MKRKMLILCSIALLLGGCGAFEKTPISIEAMIGGAVVDINGNSLPEQSLLDTEYLLLYFSAHWCPPCQAFTPKLVEFHNTNGGGHLFQTLFISSDHSEEDMLAYISGTHMPWPAIRFRSDSAKTLTKTYSGDGIPRLVLLNPAGEIIADSFKGKKYLGPQSVLKKLKKLLPKPELIKSDPITTTNIPAVTTDKILTTPDKISEKFKVNGFGQGSEESIAVINGNFTTEGAELDKGIVVEKITTTYVEISHEGNRYRLIP